MYLGLNKTATTNDEVDRYSPLRSLLLSTGRSLPRPQQVLHELPPVSALGNDRIPTSECDRGAFAMLGPKRRKGPEGL